jgi:hypothetical protein
LKHAIIKTRLENGPDQRLGKRLSRKPPFPIDERALIRTVEMQAATGSAPVDKTNAFTFHVGMALFDLVSCHIKPETLHVRFLTFSRDNRLDAKSCFMMIETCWLSLNHKMPKTFVLHFRGPGLLAYEKSRFLYELWREMLFRASECDVFLSLKDKSAVEDGHEVLKIQVRPTSHAERDGS